MWKIKRLLICADILFVASCSVGFAQSINYWDRPDDLLNDQAKFILGLACKTLEKYPPQLPEPMERRLSLAAIDGVLHNVNATARPSVQEFFHSRWDKAIKEIETTRVDEGAMVWKFYLSGFIVRTPTVTFAFDLTSGYETGVEGFKISDDVMGRAVRQCDALFVSHHHPDHADEWVARAFIEQGKPVVAPPGVWRNEPINSKITHLKNKPHLLQSLPVQNGKRELKVVIYPGHQGRIPNNVSLVFTPEGISFCHTGDQGGNRDDFGWMDSVGKHHRVDVLMPNCWSRDIVRMARGFNPRLIIPGHENAMGHEIDHREPFWLTYRRLEKSTKPLMPMCYGESFHYIPEDK